ncbi:unnamed protein product, partial [Laminaria digitata]
SSSSAGIAAGRPASVSHHPSDAASAVWNLGNPPPEPPLHRAASSSSTGSSREKRPPSPIFVRGPSDDGWHDVRGAAFSSPRAVPVASDGGQWTDVMATAAATAAASATPASATAAATAATAAAAAAAAAAQAHTTGSIGRGIARGIKAGGSGSAGGGIALGGIEPPPMYHQQRK